MELFVFLIKFLGFSQIAYDRCHLPGREKAVAGTIAFLFEFLQERKVVVQSNDVVFVRLL